MDATGNSGYTGTSWELFHCMVGYCLNLIPLCAANCCKKRTKEAVLQQSDWLPSPTYHIWDSSHKGYCCFPLQQLSAQWFHVNYSSIFTLQLVLYWLPDDLIYLFEREDCSLLDHYQCYCDAISYVMVYPECLLNSSVFRSSKMNSYVWHVSWSLIPHGWVFCNCCTKLHELLLNDTVIYCVVFVTSREV